MATYLGAEGRGGTLEQGFSVRESEGSGHVCEDVQGLVERLLVGLGYSGGVDTCKGQE